MLFENCSDITRAIIFPCTAVCVFRCLRLTRESIFLKRFPASLKYELSTDLGPPKQFLLGLICLKDQVFLYIASGVSFPSGFLAAVQPSVGQLTLVTKHLELHVPSNLSPSNSPSSFPKPPKALVVLAWERFLKLRGQLVAFCPSQVLQASTAAFGHFPYPSIVILY